MTTASSIKKELSSNDIIVFLISKDKYNTVLKNIVAGSKTRKLCYVSLNKPPSALLSSFSKAGMTTKNTVFIESVTTGFDKIKGGPKTFSVSSPKALTEIDITLTKVMKKEKIKQVIFDSLSTLLVYEHSSTVIKFCHSVISKMRSSQMKGAFTILSDDSKSELLKDLSMFADKIVKVK